MDGPFVGMYAIAESIPAPVPETVPVWNPPPTAWTRPEIRNPPPQAWRRPEVQQETSAEPEPDAPPREEDEGVRLRAETEEDINRRNAEQVAPAQELEPRRPSSEIAEEAWNFRLRELRIAAQRNPVGAPRDTEQGSLSDQGFPSLASATAPRPKSSKGREKGATAQEKAKAKAKTSQANRRWKARQQAETDMSILRA